MQHEIMLQPDTRPTIHCPILLTQPSDLIIPFQNNDSLNNIEPLKRLTREQNGNRNCNQARLSKVNEAKTKKE